MPIPNPVIHQFARSADVPAQERYEQWLVPLLSGFDAASPSRKQRLDFRGQVTSLVTTTHEMHYMQSDDFEGHCSGKHISRPDCDKLALVYVVQGSIASQYQGDVDRVTTAGQFLLFDGHRPHRMRFQQPQFVQINLPRTWLQPLFSDRLIPSEISQAVSQSALARLLALQLREFPSLSDRLLPREKVDLLQATEALAVRVVENACLERPLNDNGRYQGLYAAAVQYIRLHLDAPGLNGASLAAAMGCSRATLYRAFAAHHQQVAEYIRDLRLQALARLLQSAPKNQSIAQLGMRCGLYDTTNLSRLFRQRFGVSPRDFRSK